LGFFARLLKIGVGDTVTLRADSHRLKYRVTSVRKVPRTALASDSEAFKQTGRHRLVLVTCTGNYNRGRGGYESNLLVIARPQGQAR
jgi:LPXTG-site transpeptidase (sortase) family protein